jgi:hypothetical protein
MKMRLLPFGFLILVLLAGFFASSPPAAQRSPVARVIIGSDTPELIPTFCAWQTFVEIVDISYQHSVLDRYLAQQAHFNRIPEYQAISSSVNKLIADFATYSRRELTRLGNKRVALQRKYEQEPMSPAELTDQLLLTFCEQVKMIKDSSDSLRDSLVALDPQVGATIWNRIIEFCATHIKQSMSMYSDETPGDLKIRAIWLEFDPQPIPIAGKR